MSLEQDWIRARENGMFIRRSLPSEALVGNGSLIFHTGASDFITPSLRKSGSVYLRNTNERGQSFASFRTLVKRTSTNQNDAWSGIFFLADNVGIGTFFDATASMYQVCDQGGNLKIIKVTNTIPSVLLTCTQTLMLNTLHCLEVLWQPADDMLSLVIQVRLGISEAFEDLTLIGSVVDEEMPNTTAVSEGIFAQTQSHDDILHYTYDMTTLSAIMVL